MFSLFDADDNYSSNYETVVIYTCIFHEDICIVLLKLCGMFFIASDKCKPNCLVIFVCFIFVS